MLTGQLTVVFFLDVCVCVVFCRCSFGEVRFKMTRKQDNSNSIKQTTRLIADSARAPASTKSQGQGAQSVQGDIGQALLKVSALGLTLWDTLRFLKEKKPGLVTENAAVAPQIQPNEEGYLTFI